MGNVLVADGYRLQVETMVDPRTGEGVLREEVN
jgi:hypothetical protein